MSVSVLLFKEYVYHEYFMYNTVLSEKRVELLESFDWWSNMLPQQKIIICSYSKVNTIINML